MTKESCDDINASLARSKGWKFLDERQKLPQYRTSPSRLWLSPRDGSHHEYPPDFCGDSKYTGQLIKEILSAGKQITITKLEEGRYQTVIAPPSDTDDFITGWGKNEIEAIARAAETMIEEKR